MTEDSIFDKIIKGQIPCHKVYEDDAVLAFHDAHPQAPIHVLVIPKRKVTCFSELLNEPTEAVGTFMKRIALIAAELGLTEKGYRLVFNEGFYGGQTVPYIHAHILGGRVMEWPPG